MRIVRTAPKSLLLHPQRTLELEYQYGSDDFKCVIYSIIQINGLHTNYVHLIIVDNKLLDNI